MDVPNRIRVNTDLAMLKVSCLRCEAGPQELSPALAEMPHKVLEVVIDSIRIANLHYALQEPACGKYKVVMGPKTTRARCLALCSIRLNIFGTFFREGGW